MDKKLLKPFKVIALFVTLIIVGIALAPYLRIRLLPSQDRSEITLTYRMDGANAIVIDSEITSKLEASISRIKSISNIKSTTREGYGKITVLFDKGIDINIKRYEISSTVRQIYPKFPKSASYPDIKIVYSGDADKVKTLLTYSIIGNVTSSNIGRYVNTVIKKEISKCKGVSDITVTGVNKRQINLVFNKDKIKQLGITESIIATSIKEYYSSLNLGHIYESSYSGEKLYIPVVITENRDNNIELLQIKVKTGERVFKLSDLLYAISSEADPSSYYRIDGLNTVNIIISASFEANQIKLAKEVKSKISQLTNNLPEDYSIICNYDSSILIKRELQKIVIRLSLTLLFLLIFVFIISRSTKYLAIIIASIVANITISLILYLIVGIEIHIYSLAGITISLGLIIDNTIVVADNLRNREPVSVFRAIFAASLTTIASLVAVFFLEDNLRLKLLDFAYVIMINLSISLLISSILIPALISQFPFNKIDYYDTKRDQSRHYARLKIICRLNKIYRSVIVYMLKHKWRSITIAILLVGLPIYKIPSRLSDDLLLSSQYALIFDSKIYKEYIKPVSDIILGGTLRLFTEEVIHSEMNSNDGKTALNIRATMNAGSTLKATDRTIKIVEKYLKNFDQIEQFTTQIYSADYSLIKITFKPEYQFGKFPYILKSGVQKLILDLGAAEWSVYGVGLGFNNSILDDVKDVRFKLYGYNLDQLLNYAGLVKTELSDVRRVDKESIIITTRISYQDPIRDEYILSIDNKKTIELGIDKVVALSKLKAVTTGQTYVLTKNKSDIFLVSNKSKISNWEMDNTPINIKNGKYFKLSSIASINKEREKSIIVKENMEYTVMVEFDYVGSDRQQEYMVKEIISTIKPKLSMGYRIEKEKWWNGSWQKDKESNNYIWIIGLIFGLIFIICTILFNSLKQPLVVLATIPFSFVGLFLTFYLFNLRFDQGGYGSMILLCGLTVNSVLYILNEMNQLLSRRSLQIGIYHSNNQIKIYIKAFNKKAIPIILTIISTLLGLIPFMVLGSKDYFWFSMAAGTIGGLIFSILAIIFIVPLVLFWNKNIVKKYNL